MVREREKTKENLCNINHHNMDTLINPASSVNPTQPNENGRLFPVPSGTVAIGGG